MKPKYTLEWDEFTEEYFFHPENESLYYVTDLRMIISELMEKTYKRKNKESYKNKDG